MKLHISNKLTNFNVSHAFSLHAIERNLIDLCVLFIESAPTISMAFD